MKNLSDIKLERNNDIMEEEDYEDSELEKGTICQMFISLSGELYMGIAHIGGCGTCYHTIKKDLSDFVENEDFIFI